VRGANLSRAVDAELRVDPRACGDWGLFSSLFRFGVNF